MTDLQRLLEAEAKLTTSEWYADEKYICEVAPEGHSAMVGQWYQDDIKALVFIRNHLRPVLEATLSRMATWEARYDELASLLGCKDDTSADDVAARLIDILKRAQRIEEAARRLRRAQEAEPHVNYDAELDYAEELLDTALAQGSEDG